MNVVTAVAALVLSVAFSFHFELFPVVPGLDVPFRYAFNWAAIRQLEWGTEFISTYGPYGWLVFTAAEGDLWKGRLCFEGLVVVGGALAAVAYIRSIPGLGLSARLGCVSLLLYAIAVQPDEYRYFATLLLILLGGLQRGDHAGGWTLAGAGLLAGFALLVKFSLGFAGVTSVFAACLLAGGPGSRSSRVAIAGVAVIVGLGAGWSATGGSLGGLAEYLRTGAELARGYSSAMSLSPSETRLAHGAAAAFAALLAIWVWLQPAPRVRKSALALALPLFLVWKQGTVRQDPLHVWVVPAFGLFALSVLAVDAWKESGRRAALAVLCAAAMLLALVPINRWTQEDALRTLAALVAQPLQVPGARRLSVLRDVAGYRSALEQESEDALRELRLPDAMRERIGDASIDVYPWETGYVLANDLTWRPRPLPTSFVSFTPHLDARNASFLGSSRRPEYLLWHGGVRSIDERHLFWDEPHTFRTLLGAYDLAWTGPNVALLRSRARPRWAPPEPVGVRRARFGQWLAVPEAQGVLLAGVRIERSVWDRLVSAVFREPAVFLSLRFRSGEVGRHRFVPDQGERGLWVSPFAMTTAEFWSLARGGPARDVVAIRFDRAGGGEPSAGLRITWTRIAPGEDVEAREVPLVPPGAWQRSCQGRIDKAWAGSGWQGRVAVSALGSTGGGPASVEEGELWLTDLRGRLLPTDVVPMSSPGFSEWWAIAWADDSVGEVGFIRRDPLGGWVPSCSRVGLQ